jgi:hypothetical protein
MTFHAEVHWPAAKVVAIGDGRVVSFVDEASGAIVKTLDLELESPHGDFFGYFGELAEDPEILYVLGWSYVFAFAPSLELRWRSERIAVDGIVWFERVGELLRLSCEMDPPGGWQDVSLDRATGRELSRRDRNQG